LLPKEIKTKLKEKIKILKDPTIKISEKIKIVKEIIGPLEGISEEEEKYLEGVINAIVNNPDGFLELVNKEDDLEAKINEIFNNPRNKKRIREYVNVLRNPNLTPEEKEAILKEIIDLPDNASEDDRKYAQSFLETLINEKWDDSQIYDKVSNILGNSTGLTSKQKNKLKDGIYS